MNNNIWSSGSKDGMIFTYDLRQKKDPIFSFYKHSLEVTGLKWSPDGIQLASGGNDNDINVWSIYKPSDIEGCLAGHKAAVKALA